MAKIIPSREATRKRATVSMARDDNDRDRAHADPEIDWFFENASPNPDRVGCPPEEELGRLARKERPISDPGYEHLGHCSPCYKQFRRMQAQAQRPAVAPRAPRRVLAIATAIVLMAGASGIYLWTTFGARESGPAISGGRTGQVAVLDLRGFLVTRGAAPPGREPLKLSRNDAILRILLPVGFEPGSYEVRLIDGSLVVTVLDSKATAALEDQNVSIRTETSLKNMQPGRYQLALRRSGEDWHFFPTILK
jgi:hypothetical protein